MATKPELSAAQAADQSDRTSNFLLVALRYDRGSLLRVASLLRAGFWSHSFVPGSDSKLLLGSLRIRADTKRKAMRLCSIVSTPNTLGEQQATWLGNTGINIDIGLADTKLVRDQSRTVVGPIPLYGSSAGWKLESWMLDRIPAGSEMWRPGDTVLVQSMGWRSATVTALGGVGSTVTIRLRVHGGGSDIWIPCEEWSARLRPLLRAADMDAKGFRGRIGDSVVVALVEVGEHLFWANSTGLLPSGTVISTSANDTVEVECDTLAARERVHVSNALIRPTHVASAREASALIASARKETLVLIEGLLAGAESSTRTLGALVWRGTRSVSGQRVLVSVLRRNGSLVGAASVPLEYNVRVCILPARSWTALLVPRHHPIYLLGWRENDTEEAAALADHLQCNEGALYWDFDPPATSKDSPFDLCRSGFSLRGVKVDVLLKPHDSDPDGVELVLTDVGAGESYGFKVLSKDWQFFRPFGTDMGAMPGLRWLTPHLLNILFKQLVARLDTFDGGKFSLSLLFV